MSLPSDKIQGEAAGGDASLRQIAVSMALIQQDMRYISLRMDEVHKAHQDTQERVGVLENRMTRIEERSTIWQGAQATWTMIVGALAALVGDMRR